MITIFLLLTATLVLTGIAELVRRFRHGATMPEIFRGAFEEVTAVHWLLKGTLVLAAGCAIGFALLSVRGFWLLFETFSAGKTDWSLLGYGLWPLGGAMLSGLTFALIRIWLESAEKRTHPVDVSVADVREGIPDEWIGQVGKEKFPDGIDSVGNGDMKLRERALLAAALPFCALTLSLFVEKTWYGQLVGRVVGAFSALYTKLSPSSFGAGRFADVVLCFWGVTLLALFLFANRHYLHAPLRRHLAFGAVAMAVAGFWLAVPDDGFWVKSFFCLILLAPVLRMASDIGAFRKRKILDEKTDGIRAPLYAAFSADLERLPSLARHGYPAMDVAELDRRLDAGATKAGKRSFLAPNRLGRYMRDASVRWRHCAAALARFMTVRRSVCLINGRGTHEGLRERAVPAWDETLFPLKAPAGYRTLLDRLPLGPEWNVVRTCGSCGGCGRTVCPSCSGGYVTKQVTRYVNGRTEYHTVRELCGNCHGSGRVTCATCSGCGRMRYQQCVDTHWVARTVAAPEPRMATPDLVEESAEIEFAKRVMIEDRNEISDDTATTVAIASPPVGMDAGLRDFGKDFGGMCRVAESLDGGKVYRAEVVLAGFTIIHSCFGFRNGASGWFFGAHPEFHFPHLPVSLARVVCLLALPPVLVAAGLMGLVWFLARFDRYAEVGALIGN